MLTTISLILIFACLAIILVITIKKFPALAILDVNNLPGEKEAKFKEQIIKQRVDRDLAKISGSLGRAWLSVSKIIGRFLKNWQARLSKVKLNYRLEKRIPWPEKQKIIKAIFLEVEELLKQENFSPAEEKLIEIIGLDQKNLAAFFQLGELYRLQKKWPEGRQTYGHALKLVRQARRESTDRADITLQEIYFSLAELEKDAENLSAALDNVSEALELEPNNPRFLDLILDLSIIKKDKEAAAGYLERLMATNPENNKLADWQEKIAAL